MRTMNRYIKKSSENLKVKLPISHYASFQAGAVTVERKFTVTIKCDNKINLSPMLHTLTFICVADMLIQWSNHTHRHYTLNLRCISVVYDYDVPSCNTVINTLRPVCRFCFNISQEMWRKRAPDTSAFPIDFFFLFSIKYVKTTHFGCLI